MYIRFISYCRNISNNQRYEQKRIFKLNNEGSFKNVEYLKKRIHNMTKKF